MKISQMKKKKKRYFFYSQNKKETKIKFFLSPYVQIFLNTKIFKELDSYADNEDDEFSSIKLTINEIIFKIEIINDSIERNKKYIPSSKVNIQLKNKDFNYFDFNNFTSHKHPPLVCILCNKEGHLCKGKVNRFVD